MGKRIGTAKKIFSYLEKRLLSTSYKNKSKTKNIVRVC